MKIPVVSQLFSYQDKSVFPRQHWKNCFDDVIITGQKGTLTLGHCCNIFDITQVKNAFSSQVSNFFTGRAVFSPQINDPLEEGATKFDRLDWKSYPGLFL
jgi:hypothetical protein